MLHCGVWELGPVPIQVRVVFQSLCKLTPNSGLCLYDYNTNNPCKIFYFAGCIRPMSSTNDGLKSDSSADSSTDSDLSSDGLVALLIDCEPL